ncbi:hypothetical protein [Solitalea longa]|nr:hypothetical protein [Solitalea longa]
MNKKLVYSLFSALSALLLCSIIFQACKKDESQDPNVSLALVSSDTEIMPYQFVRFELPEGVTPENINAESVTVTIGNVTANAYPDKEEFAKKIYAYYLMVPELPAGEHKFLINVAGNKTAEVNIKVNSFTKIADPDAYIQARQTAFEQEVASALQQYDALVVAGKISSAKAESLKSFVKSCNESNKAEIAALSAEERKIYVQLIEANKSWLNEFKQIAAQNPATNFYNKSVATNSIRATESEGTYTCEQKRVLANQNQGTPYGDYYNKQAAVCEAEQQAAQVEANKKFTGKMQNAYNAAKEDWKNTNGVFKGSKAFVSTFMKEAGKGMLELAFGEDNLSDPFAAFSMDNLFKGNETSSRVIESSSLYKIQESASDNIFELDKEYNYSAEISFVNASRQNASYLPAITEIVNGIDAYNSAMVDLGQFLPYAPTIEVPVSKSEKVAVAGYTIDQISDARIVLSKNKVGNNDVVKFSLKAPVVQENINFSFRVNYQSGYGTVSKVVQATLHQSIDKILVNASPWKATEYVENGVDQFTMHEYHKWKGCNDIEYINKEQFLEGSYTFALNGTSTSSEKYHEIYFESPQGNCVVNKVDRVQAYNSTFTWSYNSTGSTITYYMNGQVVNTFTVSIQNGALKVTGNGINITMQKK